MPKKIVAGGHATVDLAARMNSEELDLFRTYGLSGKLALLRAQGFLE